LVVPLSSPCLVIESKASTFPGAIQHDLAGFRVITRFPGQIQKAGLVFDYLVGSIQHRGFSVLWLVRTTIKTGNHHLDQEMRRPRFRSLKWGRCQSKSEPVHMQAAMLAGIAQFERDLLSERVKSGLAAARARGKKPGRQPGQRPKSDKLAPKVVAAVTAGRSYWWIARDLGISKNTVLEIMKRHRENP
jgi:resolvase-like protein